MIEITSKNEEGLFLGIFVTDSNKITRIPQDQTLLEGRVDEKLKNYYFYQNPSDNGLKSLTFHLITLSGDAQLYAGRMDPRDFKEKKNLIPEKFSTENNKFKITEKLDEKIILWVEGVEQSTYLIEVTKKG